VRANLLRRGHVILVKGERCAVRDVEPTHKDGVCVRLRGRKPLYLRWDDEVDVECTTCGAIHTDVDCFGERV